MAAGQQAKKRRLDEPAKALTAGDRDVPEGENMLAFRQDHVAFSRAMPDNH